VGFFYESFVLVNKFEFSFFRIFLFLCYFGSLILACLYLNFGSSLFESFVLATKFEFSRH
jgi:hypothetical protein